MFKHYDYGMFSLTSVTRYFILNGSTVKDQNDIKYVTSLLKRTNLCDVTSIHLDVYIFCFEDSTVFNLNPYSRYQCWHYT